MKRSNTPYALRKGAAKRMGRGGRLTWPTACLLRSRSNGLLSSNRIGARMCVDSPLGGNTPPRQTAPTPKALRARREFVAFLRSQR